MTTHQRTRRLAIIAMIMIGGLSIIGNVVLAINRSEPLVTTVEAPSYSCEPETYTWMTKSFDACVAKGFHPMNCSKEVRELFCRIQK